MWGLTLVCRSVAVRVHPVNGADNLTTAKRVWQTKAGWGRVFVRLGLIANRFYKNYACYLSFQFSHSRQWSCFHFAHTRQLCTHAYVDYCTFLTLHKAAARGRTAMTRQDKTGQDKSWQDEKRQDKTRKENTRKEHTATRFYKNCPYYLSFQFSHSRQYKTTPNILVSQHV